MTSGIMNCPKCGESFQYADWENGVWVEYPEPWKCPKCKSLIVVDKKKGYGLRVESSLG